MRGRKPYAHGGDDPVVNGPGGPTPFPINTGRDFSELGAYLSQPPQPGQPGGAEGGMPGMEGMEGEEDQPDEQEQPGEGQPEPALAGGQEQPDNSDTLADEALEQMNDPGIEEPNGKPTKGWQYHGSNGRTNGTATLSADAEYLKALAQLRAKNGKQP